MPSPRFPILMVDFKPQDRNRIQNACQVFMAYLTDEQADQIADYLHPLPDDDNELIDKVSECIAIDWEALGKEPDDTLRNLSERLGKAKSPHSSKRIQQEMEIATRGLNKHPEWYDDACMCAECRSCGD